MTAQIQDSLDYLGEDDDLAAFSDGEPFSPIAAGYAPVATNTACWRGYVCRYEIQTGVLCLRELWVNHEPPGFPASQRQQPPDLNGVKATRSGNSLAGDWHFGDVGMQLAYTGGLIIGRGFIEHLYVHMGFHPAWKYDRVHELLFEQGRLIQARDLSAAMAQVRARGQEARPSPRHTRPLEEIDAWIAKCFSRRYG